MIVSQSIGATECQCGTRLQVQAQIGCQWKGWKLKFELLPLCLLFLNKGLKSTLKREILLSYILS